MGRSSAVQAVWKMARTCCSSERLRKSASSGVGGAHADGFGEAGDGVADVGESGVGSAGAGVGLFELNAAGDRPGDVGRGELDGGLGGVHVAPADERLLAGGESEG